MERDYMKKGQTSLEFVMLLLVLLFFLITVINPIAETAVKSIEDVARVSQATTAGKKLATSINYVASSGNQTSQHINLYLPKTTNITINNTTHELTINVKTKTSMDTITGCKGILPPNNTEYTWECSKTIPITSTVNQTVVSLDASNEAKSLNFKIKKECTQTGCGIKFEPI